MKVPLFLNIGEVVRVDTRTGEYQIASKPDWAPGASTAALRRRGVLAAIRSFVAERCVLELSAPVLGRHTVTDLHIESVSANESGRGWFLPTSPEYALKRALAAGFRRSIRWDRIPGRRVRRGTIEFTMLEWYRVGFSVGQLMDEVGLLLQDLGVEERTAPGL